MGFWRSMTYHRDHFLWEKEQMDTFLMSPCPWWQLPLVAVQPPHCLPTRFPSSWTPVLFLLPFYSLTLAEGTNGKGDRTQASPSCCLWLSRVNIPMDKMFNLLPNRSHARAFIWSFFFSVFFFQTTWFFFFFCYNPEKLQSRVASWLSLKFFMSVSNLL